MDEKKKEEKKMEAVKPLQSHPFVKSKRTVKPRMNKFANMDKEDFKEANRITKSTRGISNIKWSDLLKEE
ncbi:hypothetical protein QS257_16130 [Terrilactibacillus sp. S3-3]|nr:hypothetical protein QS257_16130 [Terrilactibacillus sp. S3-3]